MFNVRSDETEEIIMKAELTALIEPAPEGGFWAICPEVPVANGQGETIEDAKNSLREAIELLLEDRKADILRGLPDDAIQDKVKAFTAEGKKPHPLKSHVSDTSRRILMPYVNSYFFFLELSSGKSQ